MGRNNYICTRSNTTIKEETSVSGVGLHTGEPVTMTFIPAEENHGVVFCRVDVEGNPTVKADVDNVIDTSRGTTIGENGTEVRTVEHTMAALAGLQIDNVLIQMDGPEPPALDGSAAGFLQALKKTGLKEQNADRLFLTVEEAVSVQDNEHSVDLSALPMDDFRVTVMVDYNSQVLGSQHFTMLNIEDFAEEVSDSRTFCFLHELEYLSKSGLIKGGDLSNAIVVVDKVLDDGELDRLSKILDKPKMKVEQGILNNTELRHKNEPARHKLLDLVGDLALVGAPIKGQILAARPGHSVNVKLAKKLKALLKKQQLTRKFQSNPNKGVVFDINAISKILPHKYPFLLVDRITHFNENFIEGYKNITMNEPFFTGHFEGNPVMPGVLQLEAMAQVGGILLLNKYPNPEEIWVYFMGIDNARFKKPVIPGDQLYFKLEMVNLRRNICKMHGQGFVGNKLVCEADLTAAVVKKDA